MSLYQVSRLFVGLARDMDFVGRFAQNKDEILKDYDLTGEEVEAIKNVDLPKLYRMGVHPLLLMGFSAAHGINLFDHSSILRKEFGGGEPV